eukprot:2518034-Alexandrium_andersonii.AAC.1
MATATEISPGQPWARARARGPGYPTWPVGTWPERCAEPPRSVPPPRRRERRGMQRPTPGRDQGAPRCQRTKHRACGSESESSSH